MICPSSEGLLFIVYPGAGEMVFMICLHANERIFMP